ncbi:MAG: HEAT repeat domain-containing protein, partial [Planctomycetota bacterium]|nr:HEAT repeat domain-containing protein [Planctomycetota bacterium]
MPVVLQCSCGRKYRVKRDSTRKAIECRACGARIRIPREGSVDDEDEFLVNLDELVAMQDAAPAKCDGKSSSNALPVGIRLARQYQWHVVAASLLWILVAICWAELEPWVSARSSVLAFFVNGLPLLISAVIIAANAMIAFSVLINAGRDRPALPNSVTLIFLFTLLFFQISHHIGADEYSLTNAPSAGDWFLFTLEHAVRAADFLDTLQDYGFQVEMIKPDGHLSAFALIAFRVVIDLICLKIFVDWVGQLIRWVQEELVNQGLMPIVKCVLAGFVVSYVALWCFVVFKWQRWQPEDIAPWFVVNALSVVDVSDIIQVYDWRPHSVPDGIVEGFLGFGFRFITGLVVAGVLSYAQDSISLKLLEGRLLTVRELKRIEADEELHRDLRQVARDRLATIKANRLNQAGFWIGQPPGQHFFEVFSGLGIVLSIMLMVVMNGSSRSRSEMLVTGAGAVDGGNYRAVLQRLGPTAQDCIEGLTSKCTGGQVDQTTRLALIDTLGYSGQTAVEPLAGMLLSDDDAVVLHSTLALARIGTVASRPLADVWNHSTARIRDTAREALVEFGPDATEPIANGMTEQNGITFRDILKAIDPYWYRHDVDNPVYQRMAAASLSMELVRDTVDQLFDLNLRLNNLLDPDQGLTRGIELADQLNTQLTAVSDEAASEVIRECIRVERFKRGPRYSKQKQAWGGAFYDGHMLADRA